MYSPNRVREQRIWLLSEVQSYQFCRISQTCMRFMQSRSHWPTAVANKLQSGFNISPRIKGGMTYLISGAGENLPWGRGANWLSSQLPLLNPITSANLMASRCADRTAMNGDLSLLPIRWNCHCHYRDHWFIRQTLTAYIYSASILILQDCNSLLQTQRSLLGLVRSGPSTTLWLASLLIRRR